MATTLHVDDGTGRVPALRLAPAASARRAFGEIPPTALVLLGIFSVQIGAALAKHLFPAVGSLCTVALRIFFAAAVLMIAWRPSPRLDRRTWAVIAGYGATLGAMNLSFYLALARIPLGVAVTTEFLGPLAVALAGSRRWLDGVWALLAAGGVAMLMDGAGGALDLVGMLLALAAGACWGIYILAGAALGRHTTEGNGLALGMAGAALVVAPFGIADAGTALLQPPTAEHEVAAGSRDDFSVPEQEVFEDMLAFAGSGSRNGFRVRIDQPQVAEDPVAGRIVFQHSDFLLEIFRQEFIVGVE